MIKYGFTIISAKILGLSRELSLHKQNVFCVVFWALCCDFLEFSTLKSSKYSQHVASSRKPILNTKEVVAVKAFFSIFANLCLLLLPKNLSYRFPLKYNIYYQSAKFYGI